MSRYCWRRSPSRRALPRLASYRGLHRYIFEDGFYHQFAARQIFIASRRLDSRQRASAVALLCLPRSTALSSSFAEYCLPFSANSSELSSSTTCMPACAATYAMPDPIMPAPSTPRRVTADFATSRGRRASLLASPRLTNDVRIRFLATDRTIAAQSVWTPIATPCRTATARPGTNNPEWRWAPDSCDESGPDLRRPLAHQLDDGRIQQAIAAAIAFDVHDAVAFGALNSQLRAVDNNCCARHDLIDHTELQRFCRRKHRVVQ